MSSVQIMADAQTANGNGVWVRAGGNDLRDSGRQIERTIKITGDLGGGNVSFLMRFDSGDTAAPILNAEKAVDVYPTVGVFQVLLSPEVEITSDLSGATAPNVTIKLY